MNRTDRLVAIITMLQTKKVVRAEDIAERFAISARTVYRDMRALDEMGVPITAEAGYGYSLVEGYHLPPVMFTPEEASALTVGGMFAEERTDDSLKRHIRSALQKIRAVLPEPQREFIDRLAETTVIHGGFSRAEGVQKEILITIQEALVRRSLLRIRYYTNYRDCMTDRDVEPLGLIYYSDNWHMIAFCRTRQDIRDFLVTRIHAMEALGTTFPPHNNFLLQEYLLTTAATIPNPIKVQVLFSKTVARFVMEKRHFGFVQEVETSDGVEMTFLVRSLQSIAGWVMSYGRHATVIAPNELKTEITATAASVLEKYSTENFLVSS